MNKHYFIFSCFVISLLYSCSRYDGSPCEGASYGGYYQCNGDSMGFLNLNDASFYYFDTTMKKTFMNDQGFIADYYFESIWKIKTKQNLINKSYNEVGQCGTKYYSCYNYSVNEEGYSKYLNKKIPLNYIYKRKSWITKFDKDTFRIMNIEGKDILSVIISTPSGQTEFPLPFNSNVYGKYKYFDTLLLNNNLFFNVINSYIDTSNIQKNQVIPVGIYYSTNAKLIGFYLSNGEIWGLKN